MKVPATKGGDNGRWERMIARYLTANRIPLTWRGKMTGFTGIAGYGFRRIAPKRAQFLSEETWSKMPEYMKKYSHISNLIVFVTNKTYGDNIEDTIVVMRLSTFTEIFATHVNNDRERYIYAPGD
jgi:hypothetical protein